MNSPLFDKYTSTVVGGRAELLDQARYKTRMFAKSISKYIPGNRDARILDCGCGFGVYLAALQSLGYKNIHGIDISEEQIGVARSELGLSQVQVADAVEFLSADDKNWDIIMMMDLIEHLEVEQSIRLLALAKARLADGGRLIVMTPNAIAPFSPYLYGDITHQRAYTVASMQQSMNLAGFANVLVRDMDPAIYGIKSFLQSLLWRGVTKPMLKLFCWCSYGWTLWGIFSPNLLCIADKGKTQKL